ncbi:MAG: ferrous iron transport protein A [Lyngbya sp. HA4199-MV5]|jgi:Fe2+ transport system protein FeoA|nr:ferrous iron transport protein A [Lyngbya sp. HA4199-MV5]
MHRRDRLKHDSDLPSKPGWQGFTFVSQKHQRPQDSTDPLPFLQNDGDRSQVKRLLSQTQVGDRVRIITLHQLASDLAAMGLTCGMTIQIVSRTASGSVIVSLSGRNLGIGSAIAQAIVVEPL